MPPANQRRDRPRRPDTGTPEFQRGRTSVESRKRRPDSSPRVVGRAVRGSTRTSRDRLTAATRPDICVKMQMPTTPITTTHASESPKRDLTTALVTRSPISTKPPIAVRMPSATPKTRLIDRLGARSAGYPLGGQPTPILLCYRQCRAARTRRGWRVVLPRQHGLRPMLHRDQTRSFGVDAD